MNSTELQDRHLAELHALAASAGIERFRMLAREELIEALDGVEAREESTPSPRRRRGGSGPAGDTTAEAKAKPGRSKGAQGEKREPQPEETLTGVLDILSAGHGFIRLEGIEPGTDDVYISASQIRRCELRSGDEIRGPVRGPRRGERHRAMVRIESVNGAEPADERSDGFDALTPVAPTRRIPLAPPTDDVLVRSVGLVAPLAFGQRVLIRSEPRSGRTTLLRALVRAILAGESSPGVVVLLIDERPEEVTAWKRQVAGADGEVEIAAAAADLNSAEQVRHAEFALARAKRRAETGEDVIVIIDSLTRLAVAEGDPAAVKPVFGAGRELEEEGSGSLTIIATVLDGTADGDSVTEAVKTTENATIVLSAELASKGIFPALDLRACGVSGEDAIRDSGERATVQSLLGELPENTAEAALAFREMLNSTPSNADLLSR